MSDTTETNLRILEPSPKAPTAGDIFVWRPKLRGYFFGRVVRTDATVRFMADGILIYLFSIESDTKEPPERLSVIGSLLVPPLMTNRLPWSRGYFETVARRNFEPGERLPVHCFYSPTWKRCFDEEGNEIPKKIEPCGQAGIESYRTIDDAISDALGIARVPG